MALSPVRIPDFQQSRAIVDPKTGFPTSEFMRSLNGAFRQLQDAQNATNEALIAAGIATAAAAAAQAAADSVTVDTSIANSYVSGLTLEAFNDGADCHVDISIHTRIYGDGASVSVDGGTLTGLAHNTVIRVYYDQPSRAGGSVSYQWTSDETVAAQTGDRHSVGATVTPRSAEMGSVRGGGVSPPGFVIP